MFYSNAKLCKNQKLKVIQMVRIVHSMQCVYSIRIFQDNIISAKVKNEKLFRWLRLLIQFNVSTPSEFFRIISSQYHFQYSLRQDCLFTVQQTLCGSLECLQLISTVAHTKTESELSSFVVIFLQSPRQLGSFF